MQPVCWRLRLPALCRHSCISVQGSNLEEVTVNFLHVFVVSLTFSAFLTIKNIPVLQLRQRTLGNAMAVVQVLALVHFLRVQKVKFHICKTTNSQKKNSFIDSEYLAQWSLPQCIFLLELMGSLDVFLFSCLTQSRPQYCSLIMSTWRNNAACIPLLLYLLIYAGSVTNPVATGFCANVSSVNLPWPVEVTGFCCVTTLCNELPPRRCH